MYLTFNRDQIIPPLAPVNGQQPPAVSMGFYYDRNNPPQINIQDDQLIDPNDRVYFSFNPNPARPMILSFEANDVVSEKTLREHLLSKNLEAPDEMTIGDAILTLSNAKDVQSLRLDHMFQKRIRESFVDKDTSMVTYTNNQREDASAARLLAQSQPSAFTIFNEEIPVVEAEVSISLDKARLQEAEMLIKLQDDMIIQTRRENPTRNDIVSLTELMHAMDMMPSPEDLPHVTLFDMMSIVRNDRGQTQNIFERAMPAVLLHAGITKLKPDLHKSDISAWRLPTDQIVIDSVEIICSPSSELIPTITIASISITMRDISVLIDNPRSANEKITVRVGAIFADSAHSQLSLTMSAVVQLGKPPSISVDLSGSNSVPDMMSALPGNHVLSSLPMPLATNMTPLGELGTTSIGFTLQETALNLDQYTLISVFGSTSLSDWRSYLPNNFPTAIKIISGSFRVDSPLDNQARSIACAVTFDLEVQPSQYPGQPLVEPVPVKLGFAAEPISTSTYDYRITMGAANRGLRLNDIAYAVGLGNISSKIGTGLPLVGAVLDHIHIQGLSISMIQEDGIIKLGNWHLDVFLDEIEVIKDVLAIQSAHVTLRMEKTSMICDIRATFGIGDPVVPLSII